MRLAIYDTFATAPSGAILHFEVFAPFTALQTVVEPLVALHVGGSDPELEMLRCGELQLDVSLDDTPIVQEIARDGIAIREIGFRQRKAAA